MTIKSFARVAGCFAILGAALDIAAPAHATPDNLLVVPGQHLGRVFIGDSKAAVHRRLGAPKRTFKLAGGLTSELWQTQEGALYNSEVVYQNGTVTQIEATNPVFKTAHGLSASDEISRWLKTYGTTRYAKYRYSYQMDQRYYDWPSKGVALEVEDGSDGDPKDVYINTVIVHRKGAKVVVDRYGRPIR